MRCDHREVETDDARVAATVAAYDADAAAYGDAALPPSVLDAVRLLAERLGPGARVLEIGSGHGRDALALEDAGLRVRRTDIAAGFVALLRAQGHRADVLDPLHDDVPDPDPDDRSAGYDAVWANACLLHVPRTELPTVLARLAEATRVGGLLRTSLKEGDGEAWSTHGSIGAPRWFVYWRAEPLRSALHLAGWTVEACERRDGRRGETWLEVLAARGPEEPAPTDPPPSP